MGNEGLIRRAPDRNHDDGVGAPQESDDGGPCGALPPVRVCALNCAESQCKNLLVRRKTHLYNTGQQNASVDAVTEDEENCTI